jgi:membrane-bound ClpP family serine protease
MDPMWIWVFTLALISIILFVVEVFVPSAGILGTFSIMALVAAVLCLFIMNTVYGFVGLVAAMFLVPIGVAMAVKVFPRTPIGRRLILNDAQQAGRHIRYSTQREDDYSELLGADGEVVTTLRPVGEVRFGDRRVNCLSECGVIEPGATVRVISISGIEVKVRQIQS